MIGDDLAAIDSEVKRSLEAGPALLMTVGGMGPTADDMTVEGVARAVGRDLSVDGKARAMVAARYEEFAKEGAVESAAMNPEREKMAIVPKGSTLLENPVGAAPGVLLMVDDVRIVCLPGVPKELKGIFTTSLQPCLKEWFGSGFFDERLLDIDCNDESRLAPFLKDVAEEFPDVYVKSRPKHFGRDVRVRVTVSMRGKSADVVDQRLQRVVDALREAIGKAGITMSERDE
jgi:molybdopterin-biosynthesis enzyme MoeA-like protein